MKLNEILAASLMFGAAALSSDSTRRTKGYKPITIHRKKYLKRKKSLSAAKRSRNINHAKN